MTTRRTISSGGHWEPIYGYSRAVVVGEACYVAGTSDAGPDGKARHPGDPAAQARGVLEVIERSLGSAGFSLRDVVRTRIYITDAAHADAVGAVHGEFFGDVRPASAMIVMVGLVDPSLLVEIEADAVRG
ncbi:MAG TPA: RidA family protein [Candidatus Limnocylindrales bacterium]|nr:RidA family protein [Candidatus Limnocylindrales bacterium]